MFKTCYETEEIPEEWARGLVVHPQKPQMDEKSRTTAGLVDE